MPCTVSFPTQVHTLHGDTTKMPSHLMLAHPTLTSATASMKLPDDNETDLPVWPSPRRPPASPAFPSPASRASAGGCPRGEPPTPQFGPSAASPRSAQTPTWRTGARCGCLVLQGHSKSLQLTPHLLSDESLLLTLHFRWRIYIILTFSGELQTNAILTVNGEFTTNAMLTFSEEFTTYMPRILSKKSLQLYTLSSTGEFTTNAMLTFSGEFTTIEMLTFSGEFTTNAILTFNRVYS